MAEKEGLMIRLSRVIPAALVAALAAAPLNAKTVTADVDQIAAILQKEGYQAKRAGEGADPWIESAMNGYSMAIYFYGCNDAGKECKSVQFYAGFTPKKKPSLQAMNDYARENRWGRIYLDTDGDPAIEMDVDMEAGGMSEALFIDNIAYWNTILDNFGTFVFKED